MRVGRVGAVADMPPWDDAAAVNAGMLHLSALQEQVLHVNKHICEDAVPHTNMECLPGRHHHVLAGALGKLQTASANIPAHFEKSAQDTATA